MITSNYINSPNAGYDDDGHATAARVKAIITDLSPGLTDHSVKQATWKISYLQGSSVTYALRAAA